MQDGQCRQSLRRRSGGRGLWGLSHGRGLRDLWGGQGLRGLPARQDLRGLQGRPVGLGRTTRGSGQSGPCGRGGAAALGAAGVVLVLVLAGCGSGNGAPPVGETGLTWITVPPQEGWNEALLPGVEVIEVDGCLALRAPEGTGETIYPVFSSDDPFPATLEVGDVVSLGGSEGDLDRVGDIEILIPPECGGAQRVWFASPQH